MDANSRAFYRSLGKHIGVLRREQGITQAELSRSLGVSQQTVFAYELGARRVHVLALVTLARIFGMSLDELSGIKMPIRRKRRLSPAGVRHAERYAQLSKTQQRFVARIIEVLLAQRVPVVSN